jgi:hypothetical protein
LESKGIAIPLTGSYGYNTGSVPKSVKLDVNCGPNFRHLTEYSEPEPEVKLLSSKQSDFRSGLPLYSLDYNYRKGFHSLNGELNSDYELNGQLKNPWMYHGDQSSDGLLSWNLKNKRRQLEQMAKIDINPQKISIDSQLRKSGQNLAEISGHLTKDFDSELSIKAPRAQTRAFVAFKPNPQQNQYLTKVQFKSPRVDHVSQLDYSYQPIRDQNEKQFSLDSKTIFDNQNTYSLAGSHVPNRKSFISVKSPGYDVSGHVETDSITPSAKVTIISPKVNHVSEVSADRNRKSIRIESKTDRKSGYSSEYPENVYNFEGNYYHLNEEIPSDFAIKTGNQWKINGKVSPFGTGNRYLSVSAESPNYSHLTDIQLNDRNHVILKSRTNDLKNGRNLSKIDSYFTTNPLKDKSHVSYMSDVIDGTVEVIPSQRLAKIEFKNNEWNHKTVLEKENDLKINSLTKYRNQNYFDFNSEINPKNSLKLISKLLN